MSIEKQFKAVIASLHAAMLDETALPEATRLIEEVCGMTCSGLLVGGGPARDRAVRFIGLHSRGQRLREVEHEYLDCYYPIDERVPRIRRLADSRLVHVTELYRDGELRTSLDISRQTALVRLVSGL